MVALDPGSSGPIVDDLRRSLGAPENPLLLPAHFLKATFPRIGGRLALVTRAGRRVGVGFLLPRRGDGGRSAYTMRYHRLERGGGASGPGLAEAVSEALGGAKVVVHDVEASHTYASDPGAIGRPGRSEAIQARNLQAEIWQGVADDLYPFDLHSVDSAPGTSLVERDEGGLAGFLLGFYATGGPAVPTSWSTRWRTDLRVESQLLGVSPRTRRRGTATRLKEAQAVQARAEGIDVVTWTVDPLQIANAAVNFGRLRAVSFHHYPEYYAFSNRLNRVSAARLGVTWLISSARVIERPIEPPPALAPLSDHGDVRIVNDGPDVWRPSDGAPTIALEIPRDWTGLQDADLELARRWRNATSRFLGEHLGHAIGRYIIVGAAQSDDRVYLIAERSTPELLATLAT